MEIKFDPTVEADRTAVSNILTLWGVSQTIGMVDVSKFETETAVPAPAVPVETGAPVATTPAPAAPVAAPVETPAPAAPTPAAVAAAGVELDANGSPWNGDHHAGTKTKTAKGVFKGKRGMDKALIAAGEAADRAKLAATPAATIPTEPVVAPEAVPQATRTIEEVSELWTAAVESGAIKMADYQTIYAQLGIDGAQMAVNETMRQTLYDYLQSVMTPAAPTGLPV